MNKKILSIALLSILVLGLGAAALRMDRVISNEDSFELTVDVPISINGECYMHNNEIRCPLYITNNLDRSVSGMFEIEISSPNESVTCEEFTNIGNQVERIWWLSDDTYTGEWFNFECKNLDESALIYVMQSYYPLRQYEHPFMDFLLKDNPPLKTYVITPRVKEKRIDPTPIDPRDPRVEIHRQ